MAEAAAGEILSLPLFPGITPAQQERVVDGAPRPCCEGRTMTRDPRVFVHPPGLCESDDVGAGTRVWALAHVLPGAVVGAGCNICDHAFVEGGVRVGDRVTSRTPCCCSTA